MKKKGQAAMEFLMTYGWAILAAVIVVGVLWYLLGNPANLAGNQFQVSAPLVQKGLVINTSGITVNILNGASDTIRVSRVNLSSVFESGTVGCGIVPATPISVGVGVEYAFYMVCNGTLSKGTRINSDVVFNYTQGSSTFIQIGTGSVSGQVPK